MTIPDHPYMSRDVQRSLFLLLFSIYDNQLLSSTSPHPLLLGKDVVVVVVPPFRFIASPSLSLTHTAASASLSLSLSLSLPLSPLLRPPPIGFLFFSSSQRGGRRTYSHMSCLLARRRRELRLLSQFLALPGRRALGEHQACTHARTREREKPLFSYALAAGSLRVNREGGLCLTHMILSLDCVCLSLSLSRL